MACATKDDHQHLHTVTDCATGERVHEVLFGTHAGFSPPLWQEGRTGTFIVSVCCLGVPGQPASPYVVHGLLVQVKSGRTTAHHPVPQPRG